MTSTATQTATSAPAERALLRYLRMPMLAYVIILGSHLPMLTLQLRKMWLVEHYRYFPFLLAAVAYLFWTRWRAIPARPTCRPTRSSLAVVLVSLVLFVASEMLWSPWLGTVAAILSALAVFLSFGGRAASCAVPVWLLLWLMLPLPFRWDERLILWLQGISSQGGSLLLDYFGCNHVLAGYVIEIPGRQFLVEEACSGVQSLFTLVATAAILAVWLRRGFVHAVLFIVSAAFWAIAANVIRVTLTVSLFVQNGVDIGSGWTHTVFGLGLFVGELLMLLSTDQLLLLILERPPQPVEEDESTDVQAAPDQLVVNEETAAARRKSNGLGLVALNLFAAAFLAVAVMHAATFAYQRPKHGESAPVAGTAGEDRRVPLSDVLSEGTLPRKLGAWERHDFRARARTRNNDLGRYSISWRYTGAKEDAEVSVDFPFVGWHYLTGCYQSRGWEIESRTVVEGDESQDAIGATFVELRMRDATARRGYMLVSQFAGAGAQQTPPATPGISLSAWAVAARNRVLSRFVDLGSQPTTIQIQILVTSDLPLDDEQRQQARQAFGDAIRRITEQLWPKEKTP